MELKITQKIFQNGHRQLNKLFLLAAASLFLTFLISPKIIFRPLNYTEGDIIQQNIVADEDLLLPDVESTKLKKEQLLDNLGPVFDYDPSLMKETKNKITTAFATVREAFSSINKQQKVLGQDIRKASLDIFYATEKLNQNNDQWIFYTKIQQINERKIKALQKKRAQEKSSASFFLIKKKLDVDHDTTLVIVNQLKEKEKSFQLRMQDLQAVLSNKITSRQIQTEELESKKKAAISGFLRTLEVDFSQDEMERLAFTFYRPEIEKWLIYLLSNFLRREIILSTEVIPKDKNKKIELRNILTKEKTYVIDPPWFDVQTIRNELVELVKNLDIDMETGKSQNFITILGQKLIRPNVTGNKLELEKKRSEIVNHFTPVLLSLRKGEIVARKGDKATVQQVGIIKSFNQYYSYKDKIPRILGIALLVLFSLWLIYQTFSVRSVPLKNSIPRLLLIAMAIVIPLLFSKIGLIITKTLTIHYSEIDSVTYDFLHPVAFAAMLVGILVNFEAALMTGLLTSIFYGVMMQNNLYYFFFALMGSLVASMPITNFDSRYSLFKHGAKVSIANIFMVIAIFLVQSNEMSLEIWKSMVAAFLSGIAAAILTSIFLPMFEAIFDIVTNLKLLELSNMNNPALKELVYKAPGTYNHSILVGNLAESGAVAIGANPLLARVASYYHDLGKGEDPEYFVENQSPNWNGHNLLEPEESAEIITGHLRKGAELADKYKLGKEIKDILLQHHGTMLIKFFYHKAKDKLKALGREEELDEKYFRYEGPKPQTLEAALVMIADITEAATRSLEDPTPDEISDMVKNAGKAILEDGQLDESNLSLKQFNIVLETYSKVLQGIHHHRIKYPGQALKNREELKQQL